MISGMTHMVYPGAVHSRFEHSLGVYWLAGEAVQKIKQSEVKVVFVLLFFSHYAVLFEAGN